MTNDEYLRSLSPAELSAWFAAEHVPDYVNGTLEDYQRQRMDKLLAQRDEYKAIVVQLERDNGELRRKAELLKAEADYYVEKLNRIGEVLDA